MKTWNYSINSRPEFMHGIVSLEERPWWLAFAEWFAFWTSWEWLFDIDLPNWPKIAWERADEPCSPAEWWGTVGNVVHAYVTNPLFQWVWAHPKNKRTDIDLGYARVREIFYADGPEFFDRDDERRRSDEIEEDETDGDRVEEIEKDEKPF